MIFIEDDLAGWHWGTNGREDDVTGAGSEELVEIQKEEQWLVLVKILTEIIETRDPEQVVRGLSRTEFLGERLRTHTEIYLEQTVWRRVAVFGVKLVVVLERCD